MKKSDDGATLRLTQNLDYESNNLFICSFLLSGDPTRKRLSVSVVDDNDNSPLWINQVYELPEFEEVIQKFLKYFSPSEDLWFYLEWNKDRTIVRISGDGRWSWWQFNALLFIRGTFDIIHFLIRRFV